MVRNDVPPERPGEHPLPGAFQHIAACLDGSECSHRVMPHAVTLARALHTPLVLLHVIEAGRREEPADAVDWECRRQEAAEYLDTIVRRCRDHVAMAVQILEGAAAEQICAWVERHSIDLTILASHGSGGQSGWRLSSTARKLIDRLTGSVLVVPTAVNPAPAVEQYRRLLVPLDGSARAESVLPIAAQIAKAADAELLIVHVVPLVQLTRVGPLEAGALDLCEQITRRNERVARAYIDRVRSHWAARGFRIRAALLHGGDVRSRLEHFIEDEDINLVVLSAHGQSARSEVSCGSVASDLLLHSAAPLLIVRPRPARPEVAARSAVAGAETPPDALRLPQQALS